MEPGLGTRAEEQARAFADQREVLLGVAYRIVGQVADAEDVVQEAWLRWARVDNEGVRDARAFLVRVTSRLAIDRLRRRQARREDYVGEWLPEPVTSGSEVAESALLGESISMAMLVVLETLSPLERAVFVLREVFGFTHAEIAGALGRSEAGVRQLARRAREHVRERRPRFGVDPELGQRVASDFRAAAASGDVEGVMRLLAPGVQLVADGGGLVRAPLLPVVGADKVVRFLLAVVGRLTSEQDVSLTRLNGAPAIVVRRGAIVEAAAVLDVVDGLVDRIYLIANPAKLRQVEVRIS